MSNNPQIDEETGLPIMVPGMDQRVAEAAAAAASQPAPEPPPTTAEQARKRLRDAAMSQPSQPQPLASRHLDPNFNPALAEMTGAAVASIGPPVKKFRCKLRYGYDFFYDHQEGSSNRKSWRGPCILFLSKEEMKGQEHKLEILGDKSAVMEARTKPITIPEDMSAKERATKIEDLKTELANLEAEQDQYIEGLKERSVKDQDTLAAPAFNPDAEDPQLKEQPAPAPPAPAPLPQRTTEAPRIVDQKEEPPEEELPVFDPSGDTPMANAGAGGGPTGRLEGPEHNPEAPEPETQERASRVKRVK